jgi:sulfur-carrier protein adenylyltransferase/sulfurtransferase
VFRLVDSAIDCDALRRELKDVRAGALATFEGRVRNLNEGLDVTLLEYEAYGALAVKEGERIIEQAKQKFAVFDVVCVHRTGALALGEVAVWVGAIAAHRDAAFAATRFVIDEIKARVPIWKKEHYAGGDTGWVNCAHAHEHAAHGDWFSRQTILPEIKEEGQKKLAAARVLVVGAGGLGCPALLYLAGAGIGKIGVCDGDVVEVSNLHRQVLFGAGDVGKRKASQAAAILEARYPHTSFLGYDRRFGADMLRDFDLVLDCTDNFEAKFAIADACAEAKKTVIQASVYQWEGQLTAHFADGSGQCLRCLWPETPEAGCVGNCVEAGIVGATVGVFGSMQAMEAIKVICGIPSELASHVVFFDLRSMSIRKIKTKTRTDCGSREETPVDWRVDALDLSMKELRAFEFIDIREPGEQPSTAMVGNLLRGEVRSVPMSTIDVANPGLDSAKQYLFICQRGRRSENLVEQLRARGFSNTYSLVGGVEAVRRKFIA